MPQLVLNGLALHYEDTQKGESAVLLLHAFPLHSGMWARQVPVLASKHRVIAPDYRGLGKSEGTTEASTMALLAHDVLALLAHLGVERAVVIGLSMGGYLAFELYRQAPTLFRGLALCDTRAGADSDEGRASRETFARTALDKGLGWVSDELIPKLLRPEPDAASVTELRSLIAEGTPAGVAAAQRGMAERPDSFATLATIRCPTLVLVGAEDTLTPPAESEKMLAAMPGAKLVKIPRAGHIACIENPDAFTVALEQFLEGLVDS